MDTLSTRALTSQLADDLAWLEQHARQQRDQGRAAGQLRLAASLVRNCIGPFLDDQPATPLHVVVVGGAGAGKSTLANMLSGAVVAEANPQAGFTRHPIAYTSATGPINWAAHLGFLGPLTRLTQPSPSSLDQDVYQVRRVSHDNHSGDLLRDWVVWDCPDMTTWAAEGYIPRLIEAAALADVIVYAASDERYNDEVPTQFLKMLLQSGKPIVCCLMKMREEDAPAIVGHFKTEVLGKLPDGIAKGVVEVLPIPFLTAKQLADPIREAARWRIPLLNQVAVLGSSAISARKRGVLGACQFLLQQQKTLLDVARQDVEALDSWKALVLSGQAEFDQRYNREFLSTEKYRGFDEALVRLMQLLELPGIGQIISGTLYVLRTPYRLLMSVIGKAMARPDAPTRPEQPILEDALSGWIDLLHKEAARRSGDHQLWQHLSQAFHSGRLGDQVKEQFQTVYRQYQAGLAQLVNQSAQSIYERLEKKPVLLNTFRTGKLAIEAAAIGGTLAAGGIGWHDLILVPLVSSVTHQLVEVLGKQVVEEEREKLRQRQQGLLQEQLSTPLAEWLTRWPATGGSTFQRLQLALSRLPTAIANLDNRVRQAVR
jgi:energy-coupling factor transporter ATP-binding protein EcfA2